MSDLRSLGDDELVAAVVDGRQEAFQILYERYLKRIFSLVHRMVGGQDAEEVTQESFLQAYRNMARFRGESQFYTWLYRVASNTALQHLRRRGRKEGKNTSYEALSEAAPGVLAKIESQSFRDPAQAAEDAELQGQTLQALETLPPNQRLVILLGPVRGLSYEEMARVLEVSIPVVKARLHRARENLRGRVAAMRSGLLPTDREASGDDAASLAGLRNQDEAEASKGSDG